MDRKPQLRAEDRRAPGTVSKHSGPEVTGEEGRPRGVGQDVLTGSCGRRWGPGSPEQAGTPVPLTGGCDPPHPTLPSLAFPGSSYRAVLSQSPAWAPRGVQLPEFQDHKRSLNLRQCRDLESLAP